MRSASAGLVSLCGCRKLKTLLLAGDFMMTDSFIRSKFSIRTRRLILPPKGHLALETFLVVTTWRGWGRDWC